MILLRSSRIYKGRDGLRHPTVKITRAERAANKAAREELARALAPLLEEVFREFRLNTDVLLTQQISVAGQIGFPEDPLRSLEADLGVAIGEAFEEATERGASIGLRFSGIEGIDLDPELITLRAQAWIESSGLSRIDDLVESTRRGIREVLAEALRDDISPTEAVQRISRQVGLTGRDAEALRRFEAEQVRRLIPIPEADTQLVRETIAESVERRRDKLLRNRAEGIAETEIQEAIQEGEQEFWQQAIAEEQVDPDVLQKRWFTVQDSRVCPICRPLHNVVIPFSDDFVSTGGSGFVGGRPPAHPRCRCFLEFSPEGGFETERKSRSKVRKRRRRFGSH